MFSNFSAFTSKQLQEVLFPNQIFSYKTFSWFHKMLINNPNNHSTQNVLLFCYFAILYSKTYFLYFSLTCTSLKFKFPSVNTTSKNVKLKQFDNTVYEDTNTTFLSKIFDKYTIFKTTNNLRMNKFKGVTSKNNRAKNYASDTKIRWGWKNIDIEAFNYNQKWYVDSETTFTNLLSLHNSPT